MNYEARPTEYNGITFRSKSEAIFARGLDINGCYWEYEPSNYKLDDGYVPDFIVTSEEAGIILIEYKPKQVTNTYFNSLEKKAPICLYDRFGMADDFLFIIGSPFNNDAVEIHYLSSCDPDSVTGLYTNHSFVITNYDHELDFLFSHWDEAKKYRFDLLNK